MFNCSSAPIFTQNPCHFFLLQPVLVQVLLLTEVPTFRSIFSCILGRVCYGLLPVRIAMVSAKRMGLFVTHFRILALSSNFFFLPILSLNHFYWVPMMAKIYVNIACRELVKHRLHYLCNFQHGRSSLRRQKMIFWPQWLGGAILWICLFFSSFPLPLNFRLCLSPLCLFIPFGFDWRIEPIIGLCRPSVLDFHMASNHACNQTPPPPATKTIVFLKDELK